MKKTPCEEILWKGLPVIRKELAWSLIYDFGLSQRQAAFKLGITPAAVSQYLSRKRGNKSINDPIILAEIVKSAERIFSHGDTFVLVETCRLCRLIKKANGFNYSEESGSNK